MGTVLVGQNGQICKSKNNNNKIKIKPLGCKQNMIYKWQNILLNMQTVVSRCKLNKTKLLWFNQFIKIRM